MIERPILFSGEMVRAILDGRKSQTRRVVKPQPRIMYGFWRFYGSRGGIICNTGTDERAAGDATGIMSAYSPYGQPGDRLWVRETFGFGVQNGCLAWANYRAGGTLDIAERFDDVRAWQERRDVEWYPSIHMPRWASRITLEVTGVRVERVQEFHRRDAKAEGIVCHHCKGYDGGDYGCSCEEEFRQLWDSLNAKRGYGWDANPWVWVIEFKRVDAEAQAAA